ncbi:hypothetical protein AVEN_30709-1 [Araneus ventricosus]|uniref:Uncharacterized protein n=1 Tax=Araneus ventricosus TaxID=182803 RepID=A0A4Y2IZ30_ARAVE|nr:hypothetical protein AVEN_30709-1 [Araneus ventricosus]
MSQTKVRKLFKCLQYDFENVENDDLKDTDYCQNSQDVLSFLRENHRITIPELSEEGSISYGSIHSDRIFGYETCTCQYCAKTALCRSKRRLAFSCARSPSKG